ncbi:MAG: response regulator transcription factor [Bacillota bacterium]|nr:response regulator transcription factor [Bacillota bacterium]
MKIVIVDDHPLVRKGVEMVASLEPDLEFAGFASNGREAVELIKNTNPDVALVDLRLPGEHGLDIIKKAREVDSSCRYIILTSYATKDEIQQAMNLGVEGYILKEALPEELLSAIRLVGRGRRYFDPVVVQHAMDYEKDYRENGVDELTPRELEVLASLARGMNNKTIAETLFITEHTVKKHIGQILEKLELQDRTQAALYAVSKGLNHHNNNNYSTGMIVSFK